MLKKKIEFTGAKIDSNGPAPNCGGRGCFADSSWGKDSGREEAETKREHTEVAPV